MSVRVEFRWGTEFLERVDVARGDVARSVFVIRAVERVLGELERARGEAERAAPVSRADAFRGMIRK
jgi:hypothetical protein